MSSTRTSIALVFGGRSGEHEVSITSACSIFQALDKSKYSILPIGVDKSGRWVHIPDATLKTYLDRPRDLKLSECTDTIVIQPGSAEFFTLQNKTTIPLPKIDVVFPIIHGINGEDGTLQGLLELLNIPYVGSGVIGSSVNMDKEIEKRLLQQAGVPIVQFQAVFRTDYKSQPQEVEAQLEKHFGFPFFVKPANMGSSVGVSKVKSKSEIKSKLEAAFQYDSKVVVEKAVAARELECSVLGGRNARSSIIGEIIPHHEFYSYEAKYLDENGASLKIPAELSASQITELQSLAVRAFHATDTYGMARVDFFLDKNSGKIYLNELNTLPGFTSISMYPKLWAATGLPYSQLLDELIALAFERFEQKKNLKTDFS